MFGLGPSELIIILIIVVLLFGGKRLPELGRGIGEAMRNFKKSVSGGDSDASRPNGLDHKTSEKDDKGKPV